MPINTLVTLPHFAELNMLNRSHWNGLYCCGMAAGLAATVVKGLVAGLTACLAWGFDNAACKTVLFPERAV